jgi:signal transduction histidine kinase
MYRGNLEISFQQMQDTREALVEGKGDDLVKRRQTEPPYCDRLVRVSVVLEPAQARFTIRDEGPGFDPSKLPTAGQPGSLDPDAGRGLVLMRSFMDEVTFGDRGNEVMLVKRRENGGTSER